MTKNIVFTTLNRVQSEVEFVERAEQAAAMLDPLRLLLLDAFREPRSAAEAARSLGQPRQRIGHHVRTLRDLGLLSEVGERRRGNFVEQVLQTTARAYVVAPQALGAMAADASQVRDRFSSAYLAAAAAGILRDLCRFRAAADQAGKKLATLTLETEVCFGSPSEQADFARELAGCLAGLTAKYHRDGKGRRFRFTVAGLPAPSEVERPRGKKDVLGGSHEQRPKEADD